MVFGLLVYVKVGLPFACDVSLENSEYSYSCFWLTLRHPGAYIFFINQPPSLSLCIVVNVISCSIDKVFSINPSANVFVYGNLNVKLFAKLKGECSFSLYSLLVFTC